MAENETPAPDDGGRPGGKPREPSASSEDQGQLRESKVKRLLRRPLTWVIAAAVLLVLVVGGLLWWLHARQYEGTDDAFIDTHIVHLAPQVAGQVRAVYAVDNAFVRAGQVLVILDAQGPRAQFDEARAGREQALGQLGQARAQVQIDQARLLQARAQEQAAAADARRAAQDLARYRNLQRINPAAISQQQVDQAAAQAASAQAQRDAAARQSAAAAAQVQAAKTGLAAAEGAVGRAEAQVRGVGVSLGDTQIYAPVNGSVAKRTVAAGDYVQPGQQLLTIVPTQLWVTANFKETQLAHMRVGQPADLKIDACAGEKVDGRVASIQRGAGQAFALLPTENATGNFVKVVQRVPVIITFAHVPRDCVLGPGMSVRPSVKVR